MATSQKSLELIAQIKEELDLRLGLTQATATLSSVITFEVLPADVSDATTKYPVLLVGTGTGTEPTFRVVVKPIEWALAKDVLGLASPVYTPHEILLGVEAVSGAGAEPLSLAQKATIVAVLAARGCRLSVFESSTTDSFDIADFVSAKLKAVIEPSMKYPMIMSQ